MRGVIIFGAAAAALIATGAMAQERTGYRQIAAGNFAAAQSELEAETRTYPRRPDLLLNLAAVYRRSGRTADARELYRSVLARPDAGMDLPDGRVASSHALAHAGLDRLGTVRVTAR